MDSTKSPKKSKLLEANQDIISNLPSNVTDKILKRLPLPVAAKMGSVSTKWRDQWLSCRHLVFDETFWEGQGGKEAIVAERVNLIIVNILLHHNGPSHKFHLNIPDYAHATTPYLSQWLSSLSRTCVKKLTLINWCDLKPLPSYIFACKELVKLRLEYFALNRPPSGFKGFAYLRSLELVEIGFKHDILSSLIASCPRLTVLKLQGCSGMSHVVIDKPGLESFVFKGAFVPLHFKSIERLNRISLCLLPTTQNQALDDDLIKTLTTSCQIQYLQLGGKMSKLLAAGSVTSSLPLAFKHLKELCFMQVDLGDLNTFCFTLSLIQNCPCISDLEISVNVNVNAARHKIELDESCKLNHLTTMKITDITGSSVELQFLEYMLSISLVLEVLFFRCSAYYAYSELEVSRDLLRLRRASAKAQLVCLDQYRT